MNVPMIPAELIEQYTKLDESQQERLLAYARILAKVHALKGESGASIVQAVGFFEPSALDEIETAIKTGTEDIDWHGWQ